MHSSRHDGANLNINKNIIDISAYNVIKARPLM